MLVAWLKLPETLWDKHIQHIVSNYKIPNSQKLRGNVCLFS